MASSSTRRVALIGLASLTLTAVHGSVQAQQPSWPSKPITMVVAYPPGGDTDAIARVYAEKLGERLGQPVLVDNRPGASGVIGSAYVAKAAPDGYTLLFTPSTFPIAQHVMKVSPATTHDVVRDFTPIVKTGNIPLLLVTGTATGIKDVPQMVAMTKSGKPLSYGTPGAGSPMHLMGALLNQDAGINLDHVPYKGVAPVVTDVMGGHVAVGWVTPGAAAGHIATGKMLPLAVAERQRTKLMPNVPTLAELGYRNATLGAWMGLLGPKGMPPATVTLLNRHMNDILQMPEVAARMQALGIEPVGGAPAVLASQIAEDDSRLGDLVKKFNIRAE